LFKRISVKKLTSLLRKSAYNSKLIAFKSFVFFFLGLLFAIPFVLILWIIKPIFWLKVSKLEYGRIGHLTTQTELFLRRRQLGIYPDGPFYCFLSHPVNVANRQLLTMYKRVIPIYESKFFLSLYLGMFPILKRTPFYQDIHMEYDEYYEFNNAKPSLSFTADEITKGRNLLNQMGIDLDKDKFVCIFARDHTYLNATLPNIDWSYHDFRNSDVDVLIKTAKYLIDNGFVVIRMGSIVNKPISFSHEKMIDYPYTTHKSEFMDIFIHAHCKFLITIQTSGINSAATIFDRPVLFANIAEFYETPFGKDCVYLPIKYKYINNNEFLHFRDIPQKDHWYCNSSEFGLKEEPPNELDILEATQEMLARLEGKFSYSPESERLIEAYSKLRSKVNISQARQCKSTIGIAWLKRNQNLYF
jgi:putative glycosyltransferase (TIGR04372 family)